MISRRGSIVIIILLLCSTSLYSDSSAEIRLQQRRQKIADQLYRIYCLRGDHLGYSEKFLYYLKDKYNIKPKTPINQFLLTNKGRHWSRRRRRGGDFDYYSLLSGGLAIRESLQLNTITASGDGGDGVPVSTLQGPTVRSHPFSQMMKGRKYKSYLLAKIAPEDFYYFHFSNMDGALNFFDYLNQVGGAVYQRTVPKSVDFKVKRKILTQLAIVENKWARKFYDHVIEEMAVVGSDPFIRMGCDVSFIYKLKRPSIFYKKINGYREDYVKSHDARFTRIKISGKNVEALESENRVVCSYMVSLDKKTVIISNSKAAIKTIIATSNKQHAALADAWDFKYMRSIYPAGDEKEDAFLYLSDSFIRYLVGPQVRIKEARRMHEAKRMAELERLGLFYFQLYGKRPRSLKDLEKEFSPEELKGFEGLRFDKDSFAVVSDTWGKMGYFKANIDEKLTEVSKAEAAGYKNFLNEYNNYWREYFDPIGIRIRQSDGKTKIETCILPLINNSIYQSVTQIFGGKSIMLDEAGIRIPGEVMSVSAKFNERILKGGMFQQIFSGGRRGNAGMHFSDIFRNQIRIGMLDAKPMVDFDAAQLSKVFSGSRFRTKYILPVIAAWSLFHPISISLPLRDPKQSAKLINRFERNTLQLSRSIGNDFAVDRYYIEHHGKKINVTKFSFFGILKFRVFTTVHKGHYVMTSTDEYMYRIIDGAEEAGDNNLKGNVRAKFMPARINKEKSMYVLNMMESAREASINNYGTYRLFENIFRNAKDINRAAFDSFGFELQCPSGGRYSLNKKSGRIENSIYGNGITKVVSVEKIKKGDTFQRFFSTKQLMVNLEFTREGIKTVVDIQ